MKKRLPILIVFLSAIVVLVALLLAPDSKAVADTDGDGFPDDRDQCPAIASSVNNGCPMAEKPQEAKIDKDGDGFYAIDVTNPDNNDQDPCMPNRSCEICDYDKDGLTHAAEIALGTNPDKKDSDNDNISDKEDTCPNEPGYTESEGCKLELSIDLGYKRGDNGSWIIYWNKRLNQFCNSLDLNLTNVWDGRRIIRDFSLMDSSYFVLVKENANTRPRNIELDIVLKHPDRIQLTGSSVIPNAYLIKH
jgi:hypothetical protein